MVDKIDDFIFKCWSIDSTGWKFKVISDLWVEVVATSDKLGQFRAVSLEPFEVEQTLTGLINRIETAAKQQ